MPPTNVRAEASLSFDRRCSMPTCRPSRMAWKLERARARTRNPCAGDVTVAVEVFAVAPSQLVTRALWMIVTSTGSVASYGSSPIGRPRPARTSRLVEAFAASY